MTTKNIARALQKLGCEVTHLDNNYLFGTGRGWDIEFIGGGVLTIRKTKNRGAYDAGSDYNPGGYIFLRRIKDLNYWIA